MIIPVVIYNILALGGATLSTVEDMRVRLDTDVFEIPMTSGVIWHITPGHALIFHDYDHDAPGRYGRVHGYDRGRAPRFCHGRWFR